MFNEILLTNEKNSIPVSYFVSMVTIKTKKKNGKIQNVFAHCKDKNGVMYMVNVFDNGNVYEHATKQDKAPVYSSIHDFLYQNIMEYLAEEGRELENSYQEDYMEQLKLSAGY